MGALLRRHHRIRVRGGRLRIFSPSIYAARDRRLRPPRHLAAVDQSRLGLYCHVAAVGPGRFRLASTQHVAIRGRRSQRPTQASRKIPLDYSPGPETGGRFVSRRFRSCLLHWVSGRRFRSYPQTAHHGYHPTNRGQSAPAEYLSRAEVILSRSCTCKQHGHRPSFSPPRPSRPCHLGRSTHRRKHR